MARLPGGVPELCVLSAAVLRQEERRLYSAGPVDAETSRGGQATRSWMGGRRAQVLLHLGGAGLSVHLTLIHTV